jgi:hypothetical protein
MFSPPPFQMCKPQATLSPIHNSQNKYETTFFKNGYGTHHTQNSCNFSKCDNVIENIQIHFHLYFGLKFCTNVKNKYEKKIFDHFSSFFNLRKKSLEFPKVENHVVTFFFIGFSLVIF